MVDYVGFMANVKIPKVACLEPKPNMKWGPKWSETERERTYVLRSVKDWAIQEARGCVIEPPDKIMWPRGLGKARLYSRKVLDYEISL